MALHYCYISIFHLLTLGVGIGGNANFSVFRYQHVGISNVKLPGPNVNGFCVAVEYRFKFNTSANFVAFVGQFCLLNKSVQHGLVGKHPPCIKEVRVSNPTAAICM